MKLGSLGEVSVLREFVKLGYEVYSSMTDNTTYDFIVVKNDTVYKVEVKSTSRKPDSNGTYLVELKRVRSNKTENKTYPFDKSKVDILAVYIEDTDTVHIFNSKDITVTSQLRIKSH